MNENHENNTNESLDEREPLTKRIAKFSAFIYLGLAITVVIVATVGIFSISYDYETSLPSVSVPEVDFEPDTSLPQNVITPPEISDTPVGNEQSGLRALCFTVPLTAKLSKSTAWTNSSSPKP